MRRVPGLLLLAALAAFSSASARAQGAPYAVAGQATTDSALIREIRDSLVSRMEKAGVPGASITVMRDGRVIWSEGFGWADVEQRVPVTALTRFRVGSVSKPLTSVAVGLLVDAHKLDLDAPVQRYVPSFPKKRWPITTRLVAGHLAGIRHYKGDEFLMKEHFANVTDGLKIFENDSLLFEPGTKFSYSSYGWNLVSAVVEKTSGIPFLSFMQDSVFAPLGMTHTVADYVDSIVPFRARWYTGSADSGVVNAPYVDNGYKWAGGGFLSTTEDLVRFGEGLLEGKLLSDSTRALLWTPQLMKNGS
ncbi:MAG TPA: serine hydrolase domain-containing protein, partial [Gemmatimonadales bacterium]|nr:serine hydrolase domain-containing protein [Gemmatimonadales bacterium]